MPTSLPPKHPPPRSEIRRPPQREDKRAEDDVLREQAKTEVEERPYLDTEGGE